MEKSASQLHAYWNMYTSIYSDEDPFLDIESNVYKTYKLLGASTVILRGMKHFNVETLPYLTTILIKQRLRSM